MSTTKRYWQDLGELSDAPQVPANEFSTPLPFAEALGDKSLTGATTGRRDFLKFLGFSLSAATLAACETPVIKSIPYVNKPEDITPGVANWYASTYYDGEDYGSVLVKTREGRPIHIKGNPRFGVNRNPSGKKGSINARINSSVITLYDSRRAQGPMMREGENQWKQVDWAMADKAIGENLAKISAGGKRIVLLTDTVISPSAKQAIDLFKNRIGGTALAQGSDDGLSVQVGSKVDHVQYDTISYSGVTSANQKSFGQRVFPTYDMAKADVLVSVNADFLSGWGLTTENSWQYAVRRRPEDTTADKPMSRHWQFEARMSLSGANADQRVMIRPSQVPAVVMALHDAVARKTGGAAVGGGAVEDVAEHIEKCAAELAAAKGKSLVICGHNDEGTQIIVNSINTMLGNYGSTIDLANHSWLKQGDDAAVQQLVKDMNAGSVGAVLIAGVNPVYSLPNGAEFAAGLKKVGLSVSFSGHRDETASLCSSICPDHHWLESWNDFMPKPGHYALAQPAITPLFNTRQWPETLLTWSGAPGNYHDHIKNVWQAAMTGRPDMPVDFSTAWNQSVHDGGYAAYTNAPAAVTFAGNLSDAATMAKGSVNAAATGENDYEVQLYTKESVGSGLHANNPWLQEMPDPITKVTWDNYVCMAPADLLKLADKKHVRELRIGQQDQAYVVKVTVNGVALELPAVPVPGQTPKTVSVALGYGRGANGEEVGRAACLTNDDGSPAPIGKNAYPWTRISNGSVNYIAAGSLEGTTARYDMGLTQTQLTGMDRESIIKETTFAAWSAHDPKGEKDEHNRYNEPEMLAVHEDVNHDGRIDAHDKKPATEFNLWTDHPVAEVGHHWSMAIDLNSCIGCGACVTACISENNVPVVGKDEVRRSRDMHWMRIDRYYSSDMTHKKGKADHVGKIDRFLAMEEPSLVSTKVFFMPVMCQHCNHAPCETVCPVAATTHSNEGLNMMAYNRCIGTRYCANNCPYKVRRFNWFNYVTEKFGEVNPAWDALGRMVLNPDVVVRSRGVIEKCTMCVQQIQAGKFAAMKAGTPVKDGAIETACSAGCPTNAITFGDMNDKNSRVKAIVESERAYHMLEEIGVQPNVSYLAKVWNREEEPEEDVAVTEEAHP
jgi:MoCo/4Fe-4S cofactor protein with predicted Tat translocation signal